MDVCYKNQNNWEMKWEDNVYSTTHLLLDYKIDYSIERESIQGINSPMAYIETICCQLPTNISFHINVENDAIRTQVYKHTRVQTIDQKSSMVKRVR